MAGKWEPLLNQPKFAASTMLLLTDGTVMCQESGGKNWWRLTPDKFGSYVNGTWSPLAPMKNTRLYYASAVMSDGRVFVAGGEYSDAGGDTNTAEIFDPLINKWTSIAGPPGWPNIGDAPCCVLPNGNILLGSIGGPSTAIYNPATNTWAAGPNKDDSSSEETWTLLPDETVLTAECSKHPKAEKYVAAAGTWVSAGAIPDDLVQASSIEIGPAILLPDGHVFATGATGNTALYSPPTIANQPGSWTPGPSFPLDGGAKKMEPKDAPAALMPNGIVLCTAGPAGEGGNFPSPTQFFEYDGTSLTKIPNPPNSGGPPFVGRMLLVPTGQVLYAAGSPQIFVYDPVGGPNPFWRPQITSYPTFVRAGHTYTLQGMQINGLSQANSYGDDASMATNYPLVRIRNKASGRVFYCRTSDHTTMGVATGTSVQGTNFKLPFGIDQGASELTVVANGISSAAVSVEVAPFLFHVPIDEAMVNFLIGSLADGPLWAITPHGPVPVDPWGPALTAQARKAWADITNGFRTLQQVGKQVEAAAEQVVAKVEQITQVPSGERRRAGAAKK